MSRCNVSGHLVLFVALVTLFPNVSFSSVTPDDLVLCKELVKANPKDVDARLKLGAVYCDLGKPQKGLATFKTALNMNDSDARAWFGLGNCNLALGRVTDAVGAYEKAIMIDPNLTGVYMNLGLVYLKCGSPENAMVYFQKSIDSDPDQCLAHYHLAGALLQIEEAQKCVDELRICMEIAPDFLPARLMLASVLQSAQQYQDAVKIYEEARALSPTNPEIYWALANLYDRQLSDYPAALRCYKAYTMWEGRSSKEAKKRMKDLMESLYVSALSESSAGDMDKAIEALQTILEISPTHENARKAMERIRKETKQKTAPEMLSPGSQ